MTKQNIYHEDIPNDKIFTGNRQPSRGEMGTKNSGLRKIF